MVYNVPTLSHGADFQYNFRGNERFLYLLICKYFVILSL